MILSESSFLSACSSSEFLRLEHRSLSFDRERPIYGLMALIAASLICVHYLQEGSHFSRFRSVLRFSQPLDVLLRTSACRFVSSCCHVQDLFLFRGFSLRDAVLSFESLLPPCRCRRHPHQLPDGQVVGASASRPCSARSSVSFFTA
jgi:hypothetical protein